MTLVRALHAHNKYLVLALLVATTAVLLGTALGGGGWGKLQRALYSATHGLLGLQVILGVVVAIDLGLGTGYRWEHLGTMLLAFGLMHLPLKWKRETGPSRAKKTGLVTLAVLALIVVGILRLPFPFFGKAGAGQGQAAASATP